MGNPDLEVYRHRAENRIADQRLVGFDAGVRDEDPTRQNEAKARQENADPNRGSARQVVHGISFTNLNKL
jgi:hypothetical protein